MDSVIKRGWPTQYQAGEKWDFGPKARGWKQEESGNLGPKAGGKRDFLLGDIRWGKVMQKMITCYSFDI